ncbi:hypothetical protein SELMODRAFT_424789 [Selaginella moellendorffii]|uniref:Uncharacterized protein n=1 Tax=Selaginella moellendorffii TaxID=88036 RepID=D8SR12_SELML|nr:hypothetical protein SELMODRAFT_424789 [Selaginella moellendorffii]
MEYMLQSWDSAEVDETLSLVLAVCYIARLCASSAERSACAATLGWEGGAAQLDCMVDFARQELLSSAGIQRLSSLDAAKQDEEVSEHLELLWTKFCENRNIQVSSEIPARNTIGMNFSAPPPYRMPSNGEFRWREKVTSKPESGNTQKPSRYGVAAVPKLFGLVSKILKADFFLTLPVDRLGWNMLSTPHAHDGVRRAYAQLARHPLKPPLRRRFPDEMPSMPLLVKELVLLLQGIENSKLLRSLVAERPPLSVLPHHHAIGTCMQHARIWLGRYDLRIYYDHDLTYGRLGTHDVAEQEEEEVLGGGFSKERIPSLIEQTLRCYTHDSLWERKCKLIHMRPEDYDISKPPDTPMWCAYKKYIGHCREVPTTRQSVLYDVHEAFTGILGWETKSRPSRDGLFPPVAEDFSFEELHREKLESWM